MGNEFMLRVDERTLLRGAIIRSEGGLDVVDVLSGIRVSLGGSVISVFGSEDLDLAGRPGGASLTIIMGPWSRTLKVTWAKGGTLLAEDGQDAYDLERTALSGLFSA